MTTSELPEAFLIRLRDIIPAETYERVLESFTRPKAVSFRINPLKTEKRGIEKELAEQGFTLTPVPWFEGAYLVDAEQKKALTETDAFYEGRIYIQNLSSMIAPLLLLPSPGQTVCDLAAAPGGKTLQLAAMMQNEGWLSAVEPVKDRFFRLRSNLENQGVTIAHTYMTDGRSVGKKCPAMFDKLLLDAPCSSESRFKAYDPKSYAYWSERKVKETSKVQKRLLLSALEALKPGGEMVYCTCAYSPEENEMIVQNALDKLGDTIEVVPVVLPFENYQEGLEGWKKKRFDASIRHCRRILPTDVMDGFFLCKIKKKDNA